MNGNWTEDEINTLITLYPIKGPKFCCKLLNKTIYYIREKVKELGLKMLIKVPSEQFLNITTKEVVYFLGFLWADGHVSKYSISIETKKSDMVHLIESFKKLGNISVAERFVKLSNNKQMSVGFYNNTINNFLTENNYRDKSYVSPTKILSKIPPELVHYFYRGWIDGDGCFFIDYNNNRKHFSLTSTYEQDWFDFINLLNSLNIHYGYRQPIRKNGHKNSTIELCKQSSIMALGDFIYNGYETDLIGLPRKYETFLKIKNYRDKSDDNKMPVAQYDSDGNLVRTYGYVSEVCKYGFRSYSMISNCCNGKQKKAYGYIWKWI